MSVEQIADLVVALLVLAVASITKVIFDHSKELARLDATMTPEDKIRGIVERETDKLHSEHKEFRNEVKQDMNTLFERLDSIREAVGTRTTDKK